MTFEEKQEIITKKILADYHAKIAAIRIAYREKIDALLQRAKHRSLAALKSTLT